MNENLEIVKAAAPFITPLVSSVVETWIKPKLSKLFHNQQIDGKLMENAFATKFGEYLERSYQRHSRISILALQNQSRELASIYVPLTIELASPVKIASKILIDDYKADFIPFYKQVILTDKAGMGKSTIL